MTPEGRVKAMVKRRLQKEFGDKLYWFMPVQNGMGAPALDFFCCAFGRFLAIETKKPGGKMTPRQLTTRDAIVAAHGTVWVVDSEKDITTLIFFIRQIQNDNPI
jgi:hypothetical protein